MKLWNRPSTTLSPDASLEDLQERLELCLAYERQIVDTKFDARDESLRLQADKYEDSIKILDANHGRHEKAISELVTQMDILKASRDSTRLDMMKWIVVASLAILLITTLMNFIQR